MEGKVPRGRKAVGTEAPDPQAAHEHTRKLKKKKSGIQAFLSSVSSNFPHPLGSSTPSLVAINIVITLMFVPTEK